MDFTIDNNTHQCQECGMKFYNAAQLVNHTKKFCTMAGLDSLEGLAKYQVAKSFSKKNRNAGAYSLGTMKYQPETFTPSQIALDAKDVALHRQKLQANRQYSNNRSMAHIGNDGQNLNNYTKNMGHVESKVRKFDYQNSIAKHGSRTLGQSDISIQKLDNFGENRSPKSFKKIPDHHQYYSPPSQMPAYMRHPTTTVLDKSNTSIANMSRSQKKAYASQKMAQLDNIANMYDKSGGTNIEFRKNVDKMRKFYKKMIQEEGTIKQFPGIFVQSRVQTPINKLRDIDDKFQSARNNPVHYDSLDNQLNKSLNKDKQERNKQEIKKKKPEKKKNKKTNQNNQPTNNMFYNPQNPYSYPPPYMGYPHQNQPQIIMLPQQYQTQPSQNNNAVSQQIKYYQKMMQIKNKENKQLMSMLLQSKKHQDTNLFKQSALKSSSVRPSINNEGQKYYFETQMNPSLSPQQKILIALQRQQLDQLRLLSSLPQHLQQLKMQSVMRIIETRTKLQKQILEQKILKLQEQEKNQLYEEEKKLNNDEWVNQERKKMIGIQMKDYMQNFKNQLKKKDDSDEEDSDGDEQNDQEQQYGGY